MIASTDPTSPTSVQRRLDPLDSALECADFNEIPLRSARSKMMIRPLMKVLGGSPLQAQAQGHPEHT